MNARQESRTYVTRRTVTHYRDVKSRSPIAPSTRSRGHSNSLVSADFASPAQRVTLGYPGHCPADEGFSIAATIEGGGGECSSWSLTGSSPGGSRPSLPRGQRVRLDAPGDGSRAPPARLPCPDDAVGLPRRLRLLRRPSRGAQRQPVPHPQAHPGQEQEAIERPARVFEGRVEPALDDASSTTWAPAPTSSP